MNTDRRVVITGMGAITPIGNDLDTFWRNLQNGVSGIDCITHFDTSAYDCRIAGEVHNFEPKNFFNNPKDVRRTDRYTHLAMAAAKMAMQDSGVDTEKMNRHRFGSIISSGIGGLKTLEDQYTILLTKGPSRVSA
ncbi:MAG TPA: beta-ketoacyl synthase N-terminal-like domain-containing protein, partial [Chthoniobacterales bacterium]